MLTNLLKVSQDLAAQGYPKEDVPFGEVALYALLGFIVVFVGIAFLIFVVWLVGKIMHPTGNVATKKVEEKTTEAVPMAARQTATATASDEVDEETLAVIMAALMAYYDRQNNKCEFTLKRIKRI